MQIPLKYILRSSSSRRLTTVITILGIALVVFVFTAVLMMANGVEKTLRSTGSDDNLIVVRKAAMSEIMSILDRDAAGIISNMPQVASFADGRPMSSKEAVVIINLNKIGAPGISNVIVRGVESAAFPAAAAGKNRPRAGCFAGARVKSSSAPASPIDSPARRSARR